MFYALIALAFLIFFHELGHFLAARLCGVGVEVFSIGFGPKVIYKKIGKTQYALSLIPLGGYVKLKGQDDLDPLKKDYSDDSYTNKSATKKVIILSAGVIFNLLLAFLIYIFLAFSGVKVLSPVIDSVSESSPAFYAGLKPNDRILSIDDKKVRSFNEVSELIAKSQGEITLQIQRESKTLTLKATPKILESKNIFNETIHRPMLGIQAKNQTEIIYYKNLESIKYAFNKTLDSALWIFTSLEKLILGVVPLKELGGVVGIVNVMADIAPSGVFAFFSLVALISVNLAVLNLLPIPALDGGQIVFVLYEKITKKPMNEKVLYALTIFGWSILLTLMFIGLYNDIVRLTK